MMQKIKSIQKLNEEELKNGVEYKASWHYKYKDSSYIYIGGLPQEMTEGDLVIIFSQYGEIIDCRIARNEETGISKGFGYICYEDQRSTVLAVDNLNGLQIAGSNLLVDHVLNYKIPKSFISKDGESNYKLSGPDGKGWGSERNISEEEENLYLKTINKDTGLNSLDNENSWENKFIEIINNQKKKIDKKYDSKY